jgi:hypothetical protein
MKNKILYKIAFVLTSILIFGSCTNDLDVTPIDDSTYTEDEVYSSEDGFYQVLAKLYAGFSVSGQEGPSGDGDLSGFDEGASQYWRAYFISQELPTDECVCGWSDSGVPEMSEITWTSSNAFVGYFYYRAYYNVSLVNEFIRMADTYGKDSYTNLPTYLAEARFLRALSYWHALDLYGNGIPFVTEDNEVGSTLPEPAGTDSRGPELFEYIESELLDIVGDSDEEDQILLDARAGYVGEADKAAAWMLLAKLYLNHAVYLGEESTDYYEAGRTYANKVINDGGYSLITSADSVAGDVYTPYEFLFLADNYSCDNEIIYSINYDGDYSKTYGGTTYIICAATGGSMTPSDYGISGGWAGNRTTENLVNLFEDTDDRALWFTEDQSLEIESLSDFNDGYAVTKFKNKTRDGDNGKNEAATAYVDVNVPVFRLSDAYLMAAELDLRIDGSVSTTNEAYLQEIVDRAGTTLPSTIDLDWILDERARELYWEAHRRTDLIRFGEFTTGYDWPYKGGVVDGTDVATTYDLMPIPYDDIVANPNLVQNPGY